MVVTEALKSMPLFVSLSTSTFRELSTIFEVSEYGTAGLPVFAQGDDGDRLYILLSGQVCVHVHVHVHVYVYVHVHVHAHVYIHVHVHVYMLYIAERAGATRRGDERVTTKSAIPIPNPIPNPISNPIPNPRPPLSRLISLAMPPPRSLPSPSKSV